MWSILKKNKINKKQQIIFVAFCLCWFSPFLSNAQIEISEIMYDLEIGSDSGREWVELFNSGSSEIDLSQWFLFENETNHRINPVFEGGNSVLEAGGYAVLVDNYEKFKGDQPNFSGLVLDSAFSLNNTGEFLSIKNPDKEETDSVNYSSDWGANSDGNSLQKISGLWKSAVPTLGKENFYQENSQTGSDTESNSSSESSPQTESVFVEPIKINIKASILDLDYLPVAGADFTLKATATGLKGEALENEKYQWTLGDGSKKEGQNILHHYSYPGEYMVVLEVISGEYASSAKKKINVISPELIISEIQKSLNDNFIEIYNPSNYEVNLSWWRLQVDNNFFTLPKNTILLPKNYLKLPFDVTKLLAQNNSLVQLLYPNGMTAFVYESRANSQNIPAPVSNYKKEEISKKEEPETLYYSVEKENSLDEEKAFATTTDESDVVLNTTSLNNQNALKTEDKKFLFFDKWSLFLALITFMGVGGIIYASKLDSETSL